jgi:uncharacterized membrane protein
MNDVLRFLTQYEVLFYILFGLVILIYVRKVYLAWQDWSVAMFGLEKEVTQRKINAGLTFIFLSALLGIGLFIINTFVTPSVPGVFQVYTPTVNITPEVTVMETENPTPEVTQQGIVPTINAFLERGCVPGQIGWTYPLDGDGISGQVELKGTVKISNLGYYKVEYSPSDQKRWTTIMAGRNAIENEPFGGLWNSGDLTPGDYDLRLVVFTNQEEELPECAINVLVKAVE